MMKKKSTDWSVDVDKTGSSRISNLFPPKRIVGARKERVASIESNLSTPVDAPNFIEVKYRENILAGQAGIVRFLAKPWIAVGGKTLLKNVEVSKKTRRILLFEKLRQAPWYRMAAIPDCLIHAVLEIKFITYTTRTIAQAKAVSSELLRHGTIDVLCEDYSIGIVDKRGKTKSLAFRLFAKREFPASLKFVIEKNRVFFQ